MNMEQFFAAVTAAFIYMTIAAIFTASIVFAASVFYDIFKKND